MKCVVALALLVLVGVVCAEVALLHADSPTAIPGSYIVILKEGKNVLDRDAHISVLQDKILSAGGNNTDILFRYSIGSMIGFAARLSPDLLKYELNQPDVDYIEADQVMSINYENNIRAPAATVTQTGATWGISRISYRANPPSPLNTYTYNSVAGTGVDVYVIDTGILTTHVDFGGRATAVYNAVTNEQNTDLNGHGTHCAGTIGGTTYGVAKQVSLKAVKVLSASGSGTTAGVVAGVDYVTNNRVKTRPAVGSMSLGGGASTALDNAVANSISSGVPYAIAAGNDNANACNTSPARTPSAVTTGATAQGDTRSTFSNYGTCVKVFAPGTSITSDWIGSSNSATNTISGTSMATPHVAGAIALHLSLNPSQTPTQVTDWIKATSTPNVVGNPGTGSPNLLLYSPLQ